MGFKKARFKPKPYPKPKTNQPNLGRIWAEQGFRPRGFVNVSERDFEMFTTHPI